MTPSRRLALARIVATNALPVVGVLALDWTVSTVLVLYWLETGVLLVRGAVEGLFAGRPPASEAGVRSPFAELGEKRGGLSPHRSLPPLYPRNIPAALSALWLVLIVWPLGGVGLYLVGPDQLLPPGSGSGVVLALAGIAVANAAGVVEALRSGRYADRPVHAAIPRGQVLGLIALILAAGAFAHPPESATVSGPSLVFGVVVGTKLCVDLVGYLASTGSIPLLSRLVTAAEESPPDEPVHVPDGEPTATVRTDRTAVRLRGVGLGLVYAVLPPSGLLVFGGAFFTWAFLGTVEAVGFGVAVLAVSVLARVLEQEVLFGHLEYRLYNEGVVAHDRLLGEPQWFVPSHDIVDTRTSDGPLGDRLGLGTGVLRLQRRHDDDARLVFLPDTERVLSAVPR